MQETSKFIQTNIVDPKRYESEHDRNHHQIRLARCSTMPGHGLVRPSGRLHIPNRSGTVPYGAGFGNWEACPRTLSEGNRGGDEWWKIPGGDSPKSSSPIRQLKRCLKRRLKSVPLWQERTFLSGRARLGMFWR